MIQPVKWTFVAVICAAVSVYTNGQTQPAGQVSGKARRWFSSKVVKVNAPASTNCSEAYPKPSSDSAKSPQLPELMTVEIDIKKKVAADAAESANSLADSAEKTIDDALDKKKLKDGVDDESKVGTPANLADIVVAWAAVATDCSKKVKDSKNTTDGATIVADSDAAVVAYDNAKNANNAMLKAINTITDKCEPMLNPTTHKQITNSNGDVEYSYNRLWFPLLGKGCDSAAQLYYFQVKRTASVASQAQYLYNAEQSTNQINADLLTSTFTPGFQVILAGTATQGSSQPATTTTGSSTTTDSVATAVSKLQTGGDFNLRFPLPVAYGSRGSRNLIMTFDPNVGITISGVTGQATITQSTQYTLNVPIEAYWEFASIQSLSTTSAIFYADVKAGGDWISHPLATAIGTKRIFGIGSASAGIEFAKSVRIGMQYFFGPSQAYCVPSAGGCTPPTSGFNGFHLAVSFAPPPAKSGS